MNRNRHFLPEKFDDQIRDGFFSACRKCGAGALDLAQWRYEKPSDLPVTIRPARKSNGRAVASLIRQIRVLDREFRKLVEGGKEMAREA